MTWRHVLTVFALLLVWGCSQSEKADDLADLAAGPAPGVMQKMADNQKALEECCDDNARAMGAECCLQLDALRGETGAMPPAMGEKPAFKSGRPVQLDAAVAAKWTAVRLRVERRDAATETKTIDIPVGGRAAIGDTPFEVEVTAFVPAFKMTGDAIVSDGAEPTNPAAKVIVREAGKPDWEGWLFAKMPDVHAFPHDVYRVTLETGIAKEPPK